MDQAVFTPPHTGRGGEWIDSCALRRLVSYFTPSPCVGGGLFDGDPGDAAGEGHGCWVVCVCHAVFLSSPTAPSWPHEAEQLPRESSHLVSMASMRVGRPPGMHDAQGVGIPLSRTEWGLRSELRPAFFFEKTAALFSGSGLTFGAIAVRSQIL